MKKTLLLTGLLLAGVLSAFPFRTSCGKVVNVGEGIIYAGDHTDTMQEALAQLNTFLCGTPTKPSQIIIYGH